MKMNINQMLIFPGLYFNKHLGAVNGFVAAGSSVFTFLLSFINPLILNDHGVKTNKRGGAKSGFLDKRVPVTQPPMDEMT